MNFIGRLARQLIGPWGRRAFLFLAVAAAWAAWAVLPPWPIIAWKVQCQGVKCAALSPNGSRLLIVQTASIDESIADRGPIQWGGRIWDTATGKTIGQADQPAGLQGWVYTPGGWLGASDHGEILIRDGSTGREHFVIRHFAPDRWWWEYAVSPDGQYLATGTSSEWRQHIVQVRDLADGRLRHTLADASDPLAFSPDGRTLATGFADAAAPIRLWDVTTGQEISRFGNDSVAKPIALAFSPDGRRLAAWPGTASPKGRPQDITIWDVTSSKPWATFSAPIGEARTGGLEFHGDGRLLVARSRGPRALWDLSTNPPRSLDDLLAGTTKLEGQALQAGEYPLFSRDGSRFVVPGSGETWSWVVYDARTLARLSECVWPYDQAGAAPMISPNGRWLAAVGSTNPKPPQPWEAWLEEALHRPLPWRVPGHFAQFYDLETGAATGQARVADTLIGFAPDSQSLWSYSTPTVGGQSEIQVRQWAVPSSWPPAWLFAVTAVAILFAIVDWHRSRRRVAGAMP
jgi:WD40 repeat protein